MKEMTKLELAYLAGIIDGEGSIAISMHKRKGRPNEDYKLRLLVSNTSSLLVDWLLEKTGVGSVAHYRNPPREKPVWRWQVTSIQAGELLQKLEPFLVIKARHCAVALEMRSLVERSKRERHVKGKRGMTEMGKSIRERIRQLREDILLLNKRGKGAKELLECPA